ncbi:MAG: PLDc_N domain-containing protein [Myxococcaceae bacterium]|nr:PLDc_N domain-containing protein [Myxococcaceae bacterium]
MIRLYGLMFLVDMALIVIALIDCLSTDEYAVRNLPKAVWVLLILLFSPVGPIVWFVAGRPEKARGGAAGIWRAGSGFPEYERPRPRPIGPDDDPDFLRKLSRAEDEEMLRKWEADLRRREEELRRREKESGS